MAIELPDLPYALDALEPHMSRETLEYHYGKHHRAYVDKLNAAIGGSDYADLDLERIVLAANEAGDTGVFNNAAQALNHEIFWNSLSPSGGRAPEGALLDAINRDFGSLDAFESAFRGAATGYFGSGWIWLTVDAGKLGILGTGNADTPAVHGLTPLLTLDVWEHAYYLDFQNRRPDYVDTFFKNLIDWSSAASRFEAVRAAA